MVTLEEAKTYLRVDSTFEDSLITSLLTSAESICTNVGRLTPEEWAEISAYTADNRKTLIIRQEEKSKGEVLQMKELLRIGVLYALGYLFEHREEADHHDLIMTLRNLLFAVREGVF
ncbi:MAG: phage gp6-like head-tail connector protein [Lachnospiraceae bacterium]|nr:phage gp6-like head-tail connector protein [Lachnospiraceae bacterium]